MADPAAIVSGARRVLTRHWQADHGYTAPSPARYRWQWLWDSCFHAVCWAALGDERATVELGSLLALQEPDGFVPHMGYQADPDAARRVWGRPGASTLTQPPMWGHAVAVLADGGHRVDHLVPAAVAGLRYLLERRRAPSGLVRVVHPWESGMDDSPRWDAHCPGGFDRARWLRWKVSSLATLVPSPSGGALANTAFAACPASFNALVAFNCLELGTLANDDRLLDGAAELADGVAAAWSPDLGTWVDTDAAGRPAGSADTADALLAVLVDRRPDRLAAAAAALGDERRFGAPFGPCGVSRAHPSFDPTGYWRGPSWPQLTYLLWVAMDRAGRSGDATRLAGQLVRTTVSSAFAEYVNPLSGAGLGAVPQSWAALAAVPLVARGPGRRAVTEGGGSQVAQYPGDRREEPTER